MPDPLKRESVVEAMASAVHAEWQRWNHGEPYSKEAPAIVRAALAAAEAAGFVLVPKVATEEMITEAWRYDPLNCDVDSSETKEVYTAIWDAMIAAHMREGK